MQPRTKSSVLWGVVGTLAFGVGVQSYTLFVRPLGVSTLALLAVALLVGAAAAGATYALAGRVGGKEQT